MEGEIIISGTKSKWEVPFNNYSYLFYKNSLSIRILHVPLSFAQNLIFVTVWVSHSNFPEFLLSSSGRSLRCSSQDHHLRLSSIKTNILSQPSLEHLPTHVSYQPHESHIVCCFCNYLWTSALLFETSDHSFSGLTQAYSSPLLFDSTCKTSKTVSDHHSHTWRPPWLWSPSLAHVPGHSSLIFPHSSYFHSLPISHAHSAS